MWYTSVGIKIEKDGRVFPEDAPIKVKGNDYMLTDDISFTGAGGCIHVEKDGIRLLGNGHSISGVGMGKGIVLRKKGVFGVLKLFLFSIIIEDIKIEKFDKGILMDNVNNSKITKCIVKNNSIGLYLIASGFNKIYNNVITNNKTGIQFDASTKNIFYLNKFINNEKQVSYRFRFLTGNSWDNGKLGNYWSDYPSKSARIKKVEDIEIWDMPYAVYPGELDRYPLVSYSETVIPAVKTPVVERAEEERERLRKVERRTPISDLIECLLKPQKSKQYMNELYRAMLIVKKAEEGSLKMAQDERAALRNAISSALKEVGYTLYISQDRSMSGRIEISKELMDLMGVKNGDTLVLNSILNLIVEESEDLRYNSIRMHIEDAAILLGPMEVEGKSSLENVLVKMEPLKAPEYIAPGPAEGETEVISSDELKKIDEYLKRLENLRKSGEVSEEVYRKLREEYESKIRAVKDGQKR